MTPRPAPPRPLPRAARLCVLAVAAFAAGGCGSAPTTRFHTLLAPATAAAPADKLHPLAWELLPVTVPAQVDQPQLVVRAGDGSLAVLEHERWIAPLADEFRAAVALRLTRAFGPPQAAVPDGKLWRIAIDVQRFDSLPGSQAREDVVWALSGSDAGTRLACRSSFEQPVATGYPALAAGHRQALQRLADDIVTALAALDAGQAARCPAI
jgi:uncharacterized lipoprotein YmbA